MKETVDFPYLVERALQKDDDAFLQLYSLTFKNSFATASLFLKSEDDIKDVLQNVYFKVSQKLSDLEDPDKFEAWLKSIVENECKNYIKKEKRYYAPIRAIIEESADESIEEWEVPAPQEYMEREDLRKSVTDILNSLSLETRACLILFHFEERSLDEISKMLDIPLGTVKSRLFNGRKAFEKEFNKLRKKYPTLYSLGAVPVLLSFLAYQTKNIAVPAALSETVLSAVTSAASAASVAGAASVSAAGASAGTAATTAATATTTAATAAATTTAATTAAASIAVKITAVAVAGAVAVGGSAAVKNYVENKEPVESTTVYSSLFEDIGTTAFAQPSTETSTTQEASSQPSTAVLSTTKPITTTAVTAPATENTTKAATTKSRPVTTTRKPTTTAAKTTTTKKETTTAKPTTTAKVTTTAQPETDPPTTNPENNYNASGGVLTEYTGNESSVTIPSSLGSSKVTAIGAGAFSGNTNVRSISIPSSVTQIGQEAFSDCTSLSSVSMPSSLESIGIGAFYGCTSLSSVSVPNGTKTISDEAFAQCSSLKTITIPSSVTTIAGDAFSGCDSLNIRCNDGSAAHSFAVENGIPYTLI